jgi:hypothetical protein
MGEVLKAVLEWIKDQKAFVSITAILILVNIFIDTDWVPSWLGFYHQGWIERYYSWVFFFLILACVSIIVSQRWLGFAIIVIVCICLAVFFALNYPGSASAKGYWPLVVWLAYRSMLALLIGPGGKVADYVGTRLGREPNAIPGSKPDTTHQPQH